MADDSVLTEEGPVSLRMKWGRPPTLDVPPPPEGDVDSIATLDPPAPVGQDLRCCSSLKPVASPPLRMNWEVEEDLWIEDDRWSRALASPPRSVICKACACSGPVECVATATADSITQTDAEAFGTMVEVADSGVDTPCPSPPCSGELSDTLNTDTEFFVPKSTLCDLNATQMLANSVHCAALNMQVLQEHMDMLLKRMTMSLALGVWCDSVPISENILLQANIDVESLDIMSSKLEFLKARLWEIESKGLPSLSVKLENLIENSDEDDFATLMEHAEYNKITATKIEFLETRVFDLESKLSKTNWKLDRLGEKMYQEFIAFNEHLEGVVETLPPTLTAPGAPSQSGLDLEGPHGGHLAYF